MVDATRTDDDTYDRAGCLVLREENDMSIDNVLASVAVKDLKIASAWYAKLFGNAGSISRRCPKWRSGDSREAVVSRCTSSPSARDTVRSRLP